MQKMTNVFIVNISMRKIILEVEYSKSMIYEILKIFRRITYFMILRHLFCFRDEPLEKLWGVGGRGGGEFSSCRNFFRYQIPCMNSFSD